MQIYIDGIVLGSTNNLLYQEFSKAMQREFEIPMMGELTYFLRLQIKEYMNGTFLN